MSGPANGPTPTFWAAPDLAKAGYPVFPLKDKEPSVAGGFYACTTDVSQVAEWINEGRAHHDVAIATGLPSKVVVIDADTSEAFEEMRAEYGEPTVRTRRGGHWWFSHPRNGKVTSTKVRDGLDRKGDGGYVAVPPSRGRTWTNGIPDRGSLPVLPREFWPKRAERSDAARSLSAELKDRAEEVIARHVAKIPPGEGKGRHEHLKHLCGVLLARGVSFGDAEDVLCGAWGRAGGELAERAPREVSNTLRTTEQALAEDRATGVPSLEGITPGLYAELEEVFGWKVRVTIVGQQPNGQGEASDGSGEEKKRRNQADRLIDYALESRAALFSDQAGAPHALVDGEALPLHTGAYKWLRALMWDREGVSVGGEALKTATGTLAAFAARGGKVRELHTRSAFYEGSVYYRLAKGRVVRISRDGWHREADPPVVFRTIPNLKPLPEPERGGSLDELEELINLKTDRDKRLLKAYAATVALPHIARPILQTTGVMGSGKTTASRVIKRTFDPTAPETVRADPRDFLQKVSHSYIVMLDNQNSLPEWAVDTICRLVTGEGDSKRSLYTDDDDFIYEMRRAILLNGINPPTDRGDAQDRTLPVELERIPDRERQSEEGLWQRFAMRHGRLLGAAFDALAGALKARENLELSRRPRLADWGEYAASVYEALGWGSERFLKDWAQVVKVQNQGTLDGSPVAQAILAFMESRNRYAGLATDLHAKLEAQAEELSINVKQDKAWPKSPRWLWRRMKEVLPLLTAMGVSVRQEHTEMGSEIVLEKHGDRPPSGPDNTDAANVSSNVRSSGAYLSGSDNTDVTDNTHGHFAPSLSRTQAANGHKPHVWSKKERKVPAANVSNVRVPDVAKAAREIGKAGSGPAKMLAAYLEKPNRERLMYLTRAVLAASGEDPAGWEGPAGAVEAAAANPDNHPIGCECGGCQ